jgi:ABC-type multidrug transport system ATPase subunit
MRSEEFQINNTSEESPLLDNNERNYGSINEVNADNNIINNNNINNDNNNNNPHVQNEINKINNDFENRLTTKIIGLKKTYWQCCKKNVRAINNLYLGLENNEKFGLLGFNGSGKTTTFKSITKEILFDSGDIILFGYNNKTQFTKIRQSIGYCPQENPLFEYMKVKEIIQFYLELKGVDESVQNICDNFGLGQYLETYCVNLSGGNKRKLSFAISLMCKPKILLLDEPSTGVDPESRRIMWKNIMELTKKTDHLNMILSTHSMEEAEVLCDTVSWLKSGNFLSIGNPEQLKIKLSAGYKLHIKFIQLSQDQNIINEKIEDQFLQQISSNIKGLNNHYEFIKQKTSIKPYLNELVNVIESIKDKCSEITLQKINKDLSFDFNIHVLKERQSLLFAQVLDMKNVNNLLSEISISMESLENILTKL